jgi:hypothetical protein
MNDEKLPLFPGITVTGNATVKVGVCCSIVEKVECQHESDGKYWMQSTFPNNHCGYECKKCGEFYK